MIKLSVKQLTLFGTLARKPGAIGGCPRSWAGWYLDGIRPDYQQPGLVFGIKFHRVCAALVSTGKMPKPGGLLTEFDCLPDGLFGKMGRAALIHLPHNELMPREWQVEREWLFEWTTRSGMTVELHLRPDVCADGKLIDIIDWKSTSNKRYALKEIVDDVQANVYAVGLMRRFEQPAVRGRWVYVEKSPPHRSWPVDGIFHLHTAEEWLHENIDATIELMVEFLAIHPKALDLPADLGACQGVGRFCDFKGYCMGPNGPVPSIISLDEITRFKESYVKP